MIIPLVAVHPLLPLELHQDCHQADDVERQLSDAIDASGYNVSIIERVYRVLDWSYEAMAVATTRKIDDPVKADLHLPAQHGGSIQAEVRDILGQELQGAPTRLPFGEQLRQQLAGLGEFDLPPRNPVRVSWRADRSRTIP